MKILYLTRSEVGDRSFGGAMRANALRDALLALTEPRDPMLGPGEGRGDRLAPADVDTLVIHGGPAYSTDAAWRAGQIRAGTVSHYGLGRQALLQRRKLKRWVHGIVAAGGYDFIVAQYLDLAMLVPTSARSRMIFDPDDFRKTALSDAPTPLRVKLAVRNRVARQIARQSAHVWYSNPDKHQLPPAASRSFLPNIVVAPDATRPRAAPVPDRLLMVGLFAHPPNAQGLAWFHDHVLPRLVAERPSVQLHAIGRSEQALRDRLPNVVFRGFVDDLTAEYDLASLVVAPILTGGGTQIKVIDALAHGRPVVASAFAHHGFAADLHHETHLLVAEEIEDWVARCTWALDHREDAAQMAARGEAAVRLNYSPERLETLVAETLAKLREAQAV
jgi:glycosyltransferase involved in cell wall biosynthesis